MFGFQPIPLEDEDGSGPPPAGCTFYGTSSYAGTGTSHSVTLPSGIAAGNTIAISVAYVDYLSPPSGFTGYTLIRTQYINNTSSVGVLRTYTKVADGSEGSSLALTTASSTQVVVVAARLTCPHLGSGSSNYGNSTSATSNAPSTTITHDVMQALSMAFIDGRNVETFPSGYLEYFTEDSPGHSGSSLILAVGWKTLTATETPGAISIDGTVKWATAVEVYG